MRDNNTLYQCRCAVLLAAGFLMMCGAPSAARAQACSDDFPCTNVQQTTSSSFISTESTTTQHHIQQEEIPAVENWLTDVFNNDLQPWLQSFAAQMTASASQQTLMFGALLDAKEQIEVQRIFQRLAAEAHKDYQPSMAVCTFGTNTRSLAAAQEFAEFNTRALGRAGLVRGTGSMDTNATEGEQTDRAGRLDQLQRRYCDSSDNQNGLTNLCTTNGPTAATMNRDIDYAGIMEQNATLDIDFTNPTRSADEQDVVALGNNLYGHQAMFRLPESSFDQDKSRILDFRSVMAQRNVASASFYAIAGLKSHGSPPAAADATPPVSTAGVALSSSNDTAPYMKVLLKDLGVADDDIPAMLGDRPGYDAQMEILTKKIYQNPAFYSELYETPANVARQKVAMQAVGLMQDFDTLQSYLRTEMMLSQILELEIVKLQSTVQDEIGALTTDGEKGSKG